MGTQYIAETLAAQGHDVVYVTAHASWVTLFFPKHRAKYLGTFHPVRLGPRLVQVTPVNFLPMRAVKRLDGTPLEWVANRVNSLVERTRRGVVERDEFDLCIFSAASSMTLLPRIKAKRYIYRANDLLGGFEALPRALLDFERRVLDKFPIAEVCAVNEGLAAQFRVRHPHLSVRVVPNGVDLPLFEGAEPDPSLLPTRLTNVIYVGSFDSWTDVDLLLATAGLLPDHTFHLYGNWNIPTPARRPKNVRLYGPIRHEDIAGKMKACSVGLIPSSGQNKGRMVEKPLKYYEYLAAGVGVAATSHGGRGLEPFAKIGDTPSDLAEAVIQAKSLPARFSADIKAALSGLDWDHLVRRMLERQSPAPSRLPPQ